MKSKVFLTFDIGHSSIGWAVFCGSTLLGTGVVTFPSDDCLASKRRAYRRQRRHVRSTRQRIARMEKLLQYLGVFTPEQIKAKHTQGGGHAAPWLLAARVLASGGATEHLLNWEQLWDVLRWYAHNRGYDGNRRWAGDDGTAPDNEDADIEKVENARALMLEHNTATMAETITAVMYHPHGKRKALDVPQDEALPFFTNKSRYKAKSAAFPRGTVESEVRKLLLAHTSKLPEITNTFISTLLDDINNKELLTAAGIKLPKRFHGGLLFGQFVPRFDNRIITTCPISGGKVPSKNSKEFLLYRWLMQLANVRVVRSEQNTLTAPERVAVHQQILEKGFFTPGQFKAAIRSVTGTKTDNLDTMLMHPDAEKALVLDPVKKLIASDRVQHLWHQLPERIQKRAIGKWLHGKALTIQQLLNWCTELGLNAASILELAKHNIAKKNKKIEETELLNTILKAELQSGRAPYSREIMMKTCDEILAGFDPRKKSKLNDPAGGEDKTLDGVLVHDFLTATIPSAFPGFDNWYQRWLKKTGNAGRPISFAQQQYEDAKAQSQHDSRTNNHLIRHRLIILQRLLKDIIADPELLNGDATKIKEIVVEVNRDLKELSGKTAEQIAKDMRLRLDNFKFVTQKLQTAGLLNPSPGLIRKARVAEDLNWTCPYTGRNFDPQDLNNSNVWDKDHIVPYSQRPSDSLDSLVITKKSINHLKRNRTALEFIEWINQPENTALRNSHGIWTPKQYTNFVNGLEAWKGYNDDKRRKRRRKQLLLLPKWEEKDAGFLPRDLTITSQLARLSALALHRSLPHLEPHRITSIPGSVTAVIRTGWKLLSTLQTANPGVIDSVTGKLKNKTEIRSVTHLHHALDAIVLGLTHHHFRKSGRLWEAIVRRDKQRSPIDNQLLLDTGLYVTSQDNGKPIVTFKHELPKDLVDQLRTRLAEQRVVQHLPSDMSGLAVEENTRGIKCISPDGTVHLTQIVRDEKSNKLTVKKSKESPEKLIGLRPGKLHDQSGVRVITENYGVAILDEIPPKPDGTPGEEEDRFIIIPFANVWKRLQKIRKLNNENRPLVLRSGHIVDVPGGKSHRGRWKIFSVKNNANGMCLSLGEPDALRKRPDKQNVLVRQLLKDGMTLGSRTLTGS